MDSMSSITWSRRSSLLNTFTEEADREEEQAIGRRERMKEFLANFWDRSSAKVGLEYSEASISRDKQQEACFQIVESPVFNYAIVFFTVLAVVLAGLQLDFPDHHTLWYVLDVMCLSVFVLELCFKLFALRRQFCGFFNAVDVTLVIVHVVDLLEIARWFGGDAVLLRILRGLRVIRGVRLWKVLPELRRICQIVSNSIRAVSWGFVMLVVMLYLGGILSNVALRDTRDIYPGYSEQEDDWGPLQDFNPFMYFGTVRDSMYTLFNLVFLTEFSEFARAIWMRQPLLFAAFAVFGFCICFGVQSYIITQCVEQVAASQRLVNEGKTDVVEFRYLEHATNLCNKLENWDSAGLQVLTADHVKQALEDEDETSGVRNELEALKLPVDITSEELLLLLDASGDGEVPHSELRRNVLRLVASNRSPYEAYCVMQLSLNRIAARLSNVEQQFTARCIAKEQQGPEMRSQSPADSHRLHQRGVWLAHGAQPDSGTAFFYNRSGGLTWTSPPAAPPARLGTRELQPMLEKLQKEVVARTEQAVRAGLTEKPLTPPRRTEQPAMDTKTGKTAGSTESASPEKPARAEPHVRVADPTANEKLTVLPLPKTPEPASRAAEQQGLDPAIVGLLARDVDQPRADLLDRSTDPLVLELLGGQQGGQQGQTAQTADRGGGRSEGRSNSPAEALKALRAQATRDALPRAPSWPNPEVFQEEGRDEPGIEQVPPTEPSTGGVAEGVVARAPRRGSARRGLNRSPSSSDGPRGRPEIAARPSPRSPSRSGQDSPSMRSTRARSSRARWTQRFTSPEGLSWFSSTSMPRPGYSRSVSSRRSRVNGLK